jgi:hypothetical protein
MCSWNPYWDSVLLKWQYFLPFNENHKNFALFQFWMKFLFFIFLVEFPFSSHFNVYNWIQVHPYKHMDTMQYYGWISQYFAILWIHSIIFKVMHAQHARNKRKYLIIALYLDQPKILFMPTQMGLLSDGYFLCLIVSRIDKLL